MATIVIMPKQGLMMEEGTITSWLKKEGEAVTAGEPLFEMETDKLTITMDAEASGTLLKILHPEGDVVPITQPIAVLGEPGEDISGLLGGGAAPAQAAAPAEAAPAPPSEVPPPAVEPAPRERYSWTGVVREWVSAPPIWLGATEKQEAAYLDHWRRVRLAEERWEGERLQMLEREAKEEARQAQAEAAQVAAAQPDIAALWNTAFPWAVPAPTLIDLTGTDADSVADEEA